MKKIMILFTVTLALAACATPHPAPSVGGIKASIGQADSAAEDAGRRIGAIKAGTSKVDYKACRALDYFQ